MSQTTTESNALKSAADPKLGLLREEDKNAYAEIVQHLKQGDCILFVGSGPSTPLVGSWSKLIDDLGKKARVQHQQAESKFKFAARCRLALGEDRYSRFLYDRFSLSTNSDPWRAIHSMMVDTAFRAFVTTNYDACLEYAAGSGAIKKDAKVREILAWPRKPMTASYLREPGRAIHYIHGRIHRDDDPSGIQVVLTQKDYDKAYGQNGYLTFFRELMVTCGLTLLFCGYSFEDHELLFETLQRIQKDLRDEIEKYSLQTEQSRRPRHYVLIDAPAVYFSRNDIRYGLDDAKDTIAKLESGLRDLQPEIEFVPVLYGNPWPEMTERKHFYLTKIFENMKLQHPYVIQARA